MNEKIHPIFYLAQEEDTANEGEEEEINPIFTKSKTQKNENDSGNLQKNIIPPVGIAKPELVESFIENLDDDEKIRKKIAEIESYENETELQTLKREVLGHSARAAEALAGSIGNNQSFLEYITGISFPEKQGKTREEMGKFNLPDIENLEGASPYFYKSPKTSELREKTKESTGGYLEPKNDISKITQEITSDISSMFDPSLGRLPFMQRILLPISGQATKQTLKSLGTDEKTQDIGKLATMGILSIANLGNAREVATQAINDATNMMPRGLSFSTRPTEIALNNIKNQPWYRTGVDATKQAAFNTIASIENRIRGGRINGQESMQLRRDISNQRRALGGYNVPGNPDRQASLRYLDMVDRALLESMENYGRHVNPRWWTAYTESQEAYRVTQRSEAISNFISSRYAKPFTSEVAKIAFGTLLAQGGLRVPLAGMGVAGLLAARKSFQIINRMIHSPMLRRHYLNVINAAAQGNSALMIKELEKFDSIGKNLEKKTKNHHDDQ